MILKTDLAYKNWSKKYRFGEEKPIETFMRSANATAAVEKDPQKWYKEFLQVLLRFDGDITVDENGYPNKEPLGLKATFGGRITANVGTSFKNATLMNCFVNGPVSGATIHYNRKSKDGSISYDVNIETPDNPDNLSNIFLTILEQAKTLASEGGYGINFGFIRPRGALIKGTGIKHPGVMSYMKLWDTVSECMVKGDIDGYVDNLKNYLTKEQMKELQVIVKGDTRKGAMMGCLPCFSKNTEILTNEGWVNIVDLIDRIVKGESLQAIDENCQSNDISNPIIREPDQLYEIEAEDGSILEVTADHKFEVRNINTGKVYLKALKDIDVDNEEVKIVESK